LTGLAFAHHGLFVGRDVLLSWLVGGSSVVVLGFMPRHQHTQLDGFSQKKSRLINTRT